MDCWSLAVHANTREAVVVATRPRWMPAAVGFTSPRRQSPPTTRPDSGMVRLEQPGVMMHPFWDRTMMPEPSVQRNITSEISA